MRFVLIISRERIKVSGSSGAQTNHAKRSYVTLKPPKMTPPEEPNRHGHTVLIQAVANGCERLRTVANGCERLDNIKRTHLHPQTPTVKREPLLRIREKATQG